MNTENHTVTIPMSDYVAMKESKEMLEKFKHTFEYAKTRNVGNG